jgi:nucleotide-binding universal stress UspA family protein
MYPIRTILHPTDTSEDSQSAFRLACSLARDHGAELVVLHVYPPAAVPEQDRPWWGPTAYDQRLWNDILRLRPLDPAVQVKYRLAAGEPAAVILEFAAELNCDLIVMGTHGRTGLRRLLLGSVAEEVLRHATCPVLTVKSNSPAKVPDEAQPASARL